MNILSTRIFSLFAIILILCSTSGVQAVEDKLIGTLPAVIMLLDSDATQPSCGDAQIEAVLSACSAGATITVTIKSSSALALTILSLPTVVATPTTVPNPDGDWKTVVGAAVPAEITDTIVYNAQTRGQVLDEFGIGCEIPATDVSVEKGSVPLTQLMFSVEYACTTTGTISTLSVDLLTLI